MVHGDPYAEWVIFNHHRFVLPNGTRNLPPPKIADRIEEVRDLILAGRRAEAGRILAGGYDLLWTQSFHPGHAMTIEGASQHGAAGGYERRTDFTTGEITVTWGGGVGERRSFVSRADAVAVQQLSGTGEWVLRLTGELLGRPVDVPYESSVYSRDGMAFLNIRATYPEGQGAYGFEGLTLVVGDATVDGDRVVVRGDALLLTKLDRYDLPGWGTAALESALIEVCGRDYADLLARHAAIHGPAYARVSLDLGVSDVDRDRPVAELTGLELVERLFHSGRYLLLSSSGVLPPRLTGLWLAEWGAAWSGDFTTDANVNLQLAGANIGALPEVAAAYARLIYPQLPDWQTNARDIYGARGLLAPSRTDGEHGLLFHLHDRWPWAAWLAGADWLLYPLYEHHLVTGEPLDELAPWLAEAAVFFEDFLMRNGEVTRADESGHVVFVPSFSPETGPDGIYTAVNATMDIAAAKHALRTAAAVTGSDKWDELLDRLPPYLVDGRGALAEWAWPGYTADEDHRHVSHLYPVWPLHEITPDGTPELAVAARRALELRGDENVSAHGSLHRALVAARLRDGALAWANLDKILGRDMFFRSLMSSHNPDLETYNADAAHTLPGVLLEMLVDSQPGRIDLLPALPPGLTRGTLRGARTRTRVTVEELTWSPTEVKARLRSASAQRIQVNGVAVNLPADAPVTLTLSRTPAAPTQ